MFGDYIQAFDSNLADVVQFTGIAILVLGFSNFIWSVKLEMLRIVTNSVISGFQYRHVSDVDQS